jgi:hypothetical protein
VPSSGDLLNLSTIPPSFLKNLAILFSLGRRGSSDVKVVMNDMGFMIIVHLPLYKAVSMMGRDVW